MPPSARDRASFLLSLGLDAETAERDAEGIEHHVSERTLALFSAFANRS
jgi:DtxR family manganese transport transcriptional regulator